LSRVWNALKNAFLTGLLILVPLAVTLWLVLAVSARVDGLLDLLPHSIHPEHLLGFKIPGLGILVSIAVVVGVGAGMRYYTARRVVELYETILLRVPLIAPVYQSLKQLINTIMVQKGNQFRQVVIVEYPRPGLYAICFLTGEVEFLAPGAAPPMVSVFIPTTPNPTSGFYLMVPRDQAHAVNLSVEEAFKLIMSAGIVQPEGPRLLSRADLPRLGPDALPTDTATSDEAM